MGTLSGDDSTGSESGAEESEEEKALAFGWELLIFVEAQECFPTKISVEFPLRPEEGSPLALGHCPPAEGEIRPEWG